MREGSHKKVLYLRSKDDSRKAYTGSAKNSATYGCSGAWQKRRDSPPSARPPNMRTGKPCVAIRANLARFALIGGQTVLDTPASITQFAPCTLDASGDAR